MTKTLSMISHKIYNITVNKFFLIFFTAKYFLMF